MARYSAGTMNPSPRRRSLFWRLWLRSISVKRPQALLAMMSVLVGATVSSALLNLYSDARRKMTEEFRAYGANVILAPRAASTDASGSTATLDEGGLAPLERFKNLRAIRLLYAVMKIGRVPHDSQAPGLQNVVAVGADFVALRNLYPGWRLVPAELGQNSADCVVGARLAKQFRLRPGDSIELEAIPEIGVGRAPERRVVSVTHVVTNGASEDDQVFIPLADLQRLVGLEGRISLVEISVPGEASEVERAVGELGAAFPSLDVRPLRQIVESEGKVLGTLRGLLVALTALILVTIALCVMATMTAIALERRKDIAVMKALGASDRSVTRLFLSEGAGMGLLGGLAGFVLGALVAGQLAHRLFGVSLKLSWWGLPVVSMTSALLALVATILVVRVVRAIEPAAVLRGE